MDNKPLISIITVNLNNCHGLERTSRSVVSQTFSNYEWIVIDGGSTDGSKELIESYAQYIAYWCSEPDKGIYNAMNKGIKVANGEYCLFLNSGDYLATSSVLDDVVMGGVDKDVVYGDILIERNDGKYEHPFLLDQPSVTAKLFVKQNLPHQASFIRRLLFQKFGLYDETLKVYSDYKFFVRSIVLGGASVKKVNILVSIMEDEGISRSGSIQKIEERKRTIAMFFPESVQEDYILVDSLSEVLRYPFSRFCYSILYRLTTLYQKCFVYHPFVKVRNKDGNITII